MAITDKLTAIGNAIREKSGKSALLALDEMPTEIKALGSKEKLKASEYPDYITPEVLEVVNKVNKVRTDDSIVFVAMSDSHYCADQVINFYETETNASTVQANQAAKALTYLINADFFAHLGDVSCGADSTTPEMLKKQIEGFNAYFREAKSDFPVFICIGNHDPGIYYHNMQTDGAVHTLSGKYMYNNFTALSTSDNTVFGGEENGGYCYRDFPEKKLRVVMLNTSEQIIASQSDNGTYGAQRVWLGNALLDLNAKDDAASWGFIVLSHYPADYGSSTMKVSHLLSAYVNGGTIAVVDNDDGTNETFNFSGKNSAKFIAQFHGHIHNFLTSKLYSNLGGSLEQYDAWRMCIPNGQFNRENRYGTSNGITFTEDKSYPKTEYTAKGTSFVVNVINPSEQTIYSFCYGAGYDRVIGYGDIRIYNISSTLNNVSISNEAISIEEGQEYSATLTPPDKYRINTVTVKMGGVDITATAYSDGIIYIKSVTGNIVIEATAIFDFKGTNELAISTDINGNVYNDIGYKADTYLSGGSEGTRAGVYTSGFIPCKAGETLYFKNVGLQDNQSNHRFTYYDSSKTYINGAHFDTTNDNTVHIIITYDTNGNITTMFIPEDSHYGKSTEYIRFCCGYLGSDSIVSKTPIE